MEDILQRIQTVLCQETICSIATTNNLFVDNAQVTYYSEDLDIYFGSFNNTLKCRFLTVNPYVAVTIQNIQIHGLAKIIDQGSKEYRIYIQKYLQKFPQYQFYFELANNQFYKIDPLVIWFYNPKKGIMQRDAMIFNRNYYQELCPYESPQ
jgi:hypothetical protein